MDRLGRGYIVYGEDVDTLRYDWGDIKILSEPDVTGSESISVGMVVLAPGKGHERHNHPDSDEILFIISGKGEQMIDDEPAVEVGPGASIYIPKGVFHSTINTGWEPLRLLAVYTPSGPEDVLRGLPDVEIVLADE